MRRPTSPVGDHLDVLVEQDAARMADPRTDRPGPVATVVAVLSVAAVSAMVAFTLVATAWGLS